MVDRGQLLDQGTCTPACGDGECCVSVPIAMVSRRRAAVLPPGGGDLAGSWAQGALYSQHCQAVKRAGERCLLSNTRSEWCDCDPPLACTHSDDVALNHFFGVCQ